MTKQQVTENSGVVIRWGLIGALVLSLAVWFNTRLSAVEIQQVEQKTDIKHILEIVQELRQIHNKP
jgi:hypothetical protein